MYRGVNIDGVTVRDYPTALLALEACCKKRRGFKDGCYPGGPDVPMGHPRRAVTGVRMDRDESIRFRLYSTDVVVWNKDGSVDIDSYPSVTTTAFARCLLPSDLTLGQELMTYFPEGEPIPEYTGDGAAYMSAWSSRWKRARVCRADGTYRDGPSGWAPDEDTLNPMTVVEIDRKMTRQIAKEYDFVGFAQWLRLVSFHTTLTHEGEDLAECAEAMKAKRYRDAAVRLPALELGKGFGLKQRAKPLNFTGGDVRWDCPVTMTSLDRLRQYVYDCEGAVSTRKVTTMSAAEHETNKRRIRSLERIGAYYG